MKRSRRVLWLAVCCVVALCAGALLPLSRAAQRPARLPKKTPGARYLMFEVTVKGSGETVVDTTTRTWAVSRTYRSELIELRSGQGPLIAFGMSNEEYMKAMFAKSGTSLLASKVSVHVTINDSLKKVTTEMCPSPKGNYKETTTIITTWEANSDVRPELSMGVAAFSTNQVEHGKEHYNVFIPLVSTKPPTKPLVYTEETFITGKPTKKVIENRHPSSVAIPKVKGILEHPAIRHAEEQPMDVFQGTFDHDSGDLIPAEPVFPEIRESRFQVKVRVRYRWSTTPFSSLPPIE